MSLAAPAVGGSSSGWSSSRESGSRGPPAVVTKTINFRGPSPSTVKRTVVPSHEGSGPRCRGLTVTESTSSSTSMRIGTGPVAAKLATWTVRVRANSSVQISWSPANTRYTVLVVSESIRGYGTTGPVPIGFFLTRASTAVAPAASPTPDPIRPRTRRGGNGGVGPDGPVGSRTDGPDDTAFPPSDPAAPILLLVISSPRRAPPWAQHEVRALREVSAESEDPRAERAVHAGGGSGAAARRYGPDRARRVRAPGRSRRAR